VLCMCVCVCVGKGVGRYRACVYTVYSKLHTVRLQQALMSQIPSTYLNFQNYKVHALMATEIPALLYY